MTDFIVSFKVIKLGWHADQKEPCIKTNQGQWWGWGNGEIRNIMWDSSGILIYNLVQKFSLSNKSMNIWASHMHRFYNTLSIYFKSLESYHRGSCFIFRCTLQRGLSGTYVCIHSMQHQCSLLCWMLFSRYIVYHVQLLSFLDEKLQDHQSEWDSSYWGQGRYKNSWQVVYHMWFCVKTLLLSFADHTSSTEIYGKVVLHQQIIDDRSLGQWLQQMYSR